MNPSYQNSLYLHHLNTVPSIGPARVLKLYMHFKSVENIKNASSRELSFVGISEEGQKEIKNTAIPYENLSVKLEAENIKLLFFEDEQYPQLLKEISKPPALLYYKGTLGPSDELCISVVGTRKISHYGRTVIPFLLEPLIQKNIAIVSGLAFGVDSQSHKLAVDMKKRTIAVVGNGLDTHSFYPKDHNFLADQIIEARGLILSEYPPGTPPLKHHFLARNRIIAGLSHATVIIECNQKSGSLITAQYALEENRSVFAVPGQIYSETSQGPHNLIKMGAKILTTANDIFEDLHIQALPEQLEIQTTLTESPLEKSIMGLLSFDPLHINAIIKLSGLPASEVSSAMVFLEMKGRVRNVGAQQYTKTR